MTDLLQRKSSVAKDSVSLSLSDWYSGSVWSEAAAVPWGVLFSSRVNEEEAHTHKSGIEYICIRGFHQQAVQANYDVVIDAARVDMHMHKW